MRRILFLLAVLLSMCDMTKAHDVCIDGIFYDLIPKANIAFVVKGTNDYSGDIVIPSTISYEDGTYSVTEIEEMAFFCCRGLTSITIPTSVTSIGNEAFSGCSNLTSLTIPNSVTNIGNRAFSFCSGLTSVSIPNSVITIGDHAFSGCGKLKSVTIPNSVTSIGSSAFGGGKNGKSVHITDIECWCKIDFKSAYSNPLYYHGNLYLNDSLMENLTIPNSITTIKPFTFGWCKSLNTVIIPNSVTSIGNEAFSGCSNLTSVTIPHSVTSIGESAFSHCM